MQILLWIVTHLPLIIAGWMLLALIVGFSVGALIRKYPPLPAPLPPDDEMRETTTVHIDGDETGRTEFRRKL